MLADLVKTVVDSYPRLNKTSCCSYGVISDDGIHSKSNILHVCHFQLPMSAYNTYDQLITSYPVKDEVDLKFFNFMKNYLYKKWTSYILLEQTEDDKYYIRVTNLSEFPANVLYNLCICSRIIVERPQYLQFWDELVTLGVNNALAFALCRCTLQCPDKPLLDRTIDTIGNDNHHWPFYTRLNLANLIANDLVDVSKDYKLDPRKCIPTNTIWGDHHHLRSAIGKTLREFCSSWHEKLKLKEIPE